MTPLEAIAKDLARATRRLSFGPPVTHVYAPLEYAWEPHARYLERWGAGKKEVVLLGMNPGPFGMAQTGVPFGDVTLVRGWLGVEGAVGRPEREHPDRPVTGFACPRGEVSGRRLWGWARDRWRTPERFFGRFFVANYCPLAFLEERGTNRTPDKLPAEERAALLEVCDRALVRTVEALGPRVVVGVGTFAAGRARDALEGSGVEVAVMPHPSPASPAANRGWAPAATEALRAAAIEVPGD